MLRLLRVKFLPFLVLIPTGFAFAAASPSHDEECIALLVKAAHSDTLVSSDGGPNPSGPAILAAERFFSLPHRYLPFGYYRTSAELLDKWNNLQTYEGGQIYAQLLLKWATMLANEVSPEVAELFLATTANRGGDPSDDNRQLFSSLPSLSDLLLALQTYRPKPPERWDERRYHAIEEMMLKTVLEGVRAAQGALGQLGNAKATLHLRLTSLAGKPLAWDADQFATPNGKIYELSSKTGPFPVGPFLLLNTAHCPSLASDVSTHVVASVNDADNLRLGVALALPRNVADAFNQDLVDLRKWLSDRLHRGKIAE